MNRENKQVSKVVLYILISCILAGAFYTIITYTFTDYFIYQARLDNGGITVGEFCQNYNQNLQYETSNNVSYVILLIGASNIQGGINATYMEEQLTDISKRQNKETNASLPESYTVYNLGIGGGVPITQSLYIECYQKLHPSLIVYGTNRYLFTGYDEILDYYVILSQYWNISKNDARRSYLSSESQKLLDYNILEKTFYKRKYLPGFVSAVVHNIYIVVRYGPSQNTLGIGIEDGFRGVKTPFNPNARKLSLDEIQKMTTLGYGQNYSMFFPPPFYVQNNTEIKALEYMATAFHKSNISFAVINTPRHRLILSTSNITDEEHYTQYMTDASKKYGFTYVDIENLYHDENSDKYFFDTDHLSPPGKENFTATIAIDLITSGAIRSKER